MYMFRKNRSALASPMPELEQGEENTKGEKFSKYAYQIFSR